MITHNGKPVDRLTPGDTIRYLEDGEAQWLTIERKEVFMQCRGADRLPIGPLTEDGFKRLALILAGVNGCGASYEELILGWHKNEPGQLVHMSEIRQAPSPPQLTLDGRSVERLEEGDLIRYRHRNGTPCLTIERRFQPMTLMGNESMPIGSMGSEEFEQMMVVLAELNGLQANALQSSFCWGDATPDDVLYEAVVLRP